MLQLPWAGILMAWGPLCPRAPSYLPDYRGEPRRISGCLFISSEVGAPCSASLAPTVKGVSLTEQRNAGLSPLSLNHLQYYIAPSMAQHNTVHPLHLKASISSLCSSFLSPSAPSLNLRSYCPVLSCCSIEFEKLSAFGKSHSKPWFPNISLLISSANQYLSFCLLLCLTDTKQAAQTLFANYILSSILYLNNQSV